jgi:hypothetical protein
MGHALGGAILEHSVPLASLALGSRPTAAKRVFLKSVLENLPERGADMRHRAMRAMGQLLRCRSNGQRQVSCSAGRSAGAQ